MSGKLNPPQSPRFTVHLIVGEPLFPGGPTQIVGGYTSPEQADTNLRAYMNITPRKHHYQVVPVLVMGRPNVVGP